MPSSAEIARAYVRLIARSERDLDTTVINDEHCLVWMGARGGNGGYGYIGIGSSLVMGVHRLAWIVRHGKPKAGLCVLHRCDNPPCIEDAHHFLGTKKDNSADMVAKGRSPNTRGERSGRAKLTEAQVREIRRRRAAGETPTILANEFGVHPYSIWCIVRHKRWAHIA